jgi:hypothetical protein
MPQPPQCALSMPGVTHMPLQQLWASPHTELQPPQWLDVSMFMQLPPQQS